MMVPHAIKVMIVDDHPIVRGGLTKMLPVFDDLELTGEAASPCSLSSSLLDFN